VSGPRDSESPPIDAYLSEPAALGMKLCRGPDLPPRRRPAGIVAVWLWRPSRSLDQLLPELLAFLQAEIRADELADAATQERAA
jgi:hypothetical protein